MKVPRQITGRVREEALARFGGSAEAQPMLAEWSDEALAQWVQEDRRRTAHHEAGHAVLFTRLRVARVEAITIAVGDDYVGRTWVDGALCDPRSNDVACGAFAGVAAVHILDDEGDFADTMSELLNDPGGAGGDLALARRSVWDNERALWRQAHRALSLCRKTWPAISGVANALIARETISGDEFRAIVKGVKS
jgi:hypothetical protein